MQLQVTMFFLGLLVYLSSLNYAQGGAPITDFQKEVFNTMKGYLVDDTYYRTIEGKKNMIIRFKLSTTYWCEDDKERPKGGQLTDFQDIYIRDFVGMQMKFERIRDVKIHTALKIKWEKTLRKYCAEDKKITAADTGNELLKDNSLERPLPIGTPLTYFQQTEFQETRADHKLLNQTYRAEGGDEKILQEFTEMATRYCEESKRMPLGELSVFQKETTDQYLKIYRQHVSKYDGEEGAAEFTCRWNLRRLKYCAEAEMDSDFENGLMDSLGTPVTYYQRTVLQNELRINRIANSEIQGETGEVSFLLQFINTNDRYCSELWKSQFKITEFQKKTTAQALDIFRRYNPSMYNGDQGAELFLAKWNDVRTKYCEEAFRRLRELRKRHEEAEREKEAAEKNITLPAPPPPPDTRRTVVLTVHFLLRVQETAKSPKQYQDHTSLIVMARKYTVEEMANKIKNLRQAKVGELMGKGYEVLDDPWKYGKQLYIQGHDEPIFGMSKANTGGEEKMSKWVEGAGPHMHIYTYDPKESRVKIKRSTERMIHFIFHARIKCYYFFNSTSVKYNDFADRTIGELVFEALKPIVKKYGHIEEGSFYNSGRTYYLSNSKKLFKDVYVDVEEGDEEADGGEEDEAEEESEEGLLNFPENPDSVEAQNYEITLREKLKNSEVKDQDPLLIYNFNPRMKQPWMI